MIEDDRKLIRSDNCREFKQGNVTVRVEIFQFEGDTQWAMESEALTTATTLMSWSHPFDTEDEALAEFARTLADEGFEGFVTKVHSVGDPSAPALRP